VPLEQLAKGHQEGEAFKKYLQEHPKPAREQFGVPAPADLLM